MRSGVPPCRRAALAAIGLACGGWIAGAAAQAPSPPTRWDVLDAERTVAFGYAAILERHLLPLTARIIAIDAMRGLAELDPQFAIAEQDGRIRLSSADRIVADYPAPAAGDSEAWARLTIGVALDAGDLSPLVRGADPERLYRALFEGALGKADMHSRYAGASEARENRAHRNGFGGIGIRFDIVGGEPRITDVVEDTPAAKAGLLPDDVIVLIDGRPVRDLDRAEVSARLRGAIASALAVTVLRAGQPIVVVLRRTLIVPRTVTLSLDGSTALVRISSFNKRTAASLEAALGDARSRLGPALTGVVLDLRGNPGGLLDMAVAVADLFVAQGTIVSTRGRHPESDARLTAHSGDIAEDLPVVVLIDGRSASAAEIVAAALQDAGRAVVIGTNSYGKGTVQTVIRLPNDGEITLTWSRFHAPSGYALQGLGILPALCTAPEAGQAGQDPARTARALGLWRMAGLDDHELHRRLRALCPPSRRADAAEDLALARRVLGTPTLYARALAASHLGEPAPTGLAARSGPTALPENKTPRPQGGAWR